MGKYMCDIDDFDRQGRSVANDRLAPGGRRRKNGTVSTMAYNFQEIPDNMVLTDRRNIREAEPSFKDLIVGRLKRYAAEKFVEITEHVVDKGVDWAGQKIDEGIQNARDRREEYKELRKEGYTTKAEKLMAERRAKALKAENVIDFEAKRRELRAV